MMLGKERGTLSLSLREKGPTQGGKEVGTQTQTEAEQDANET